MKCFSNLHNTAVKNGFLYPLGLNLLSKIKICKIFSTSEDKTHRKPISLSKPISQFPAGNAHSMLLRENFPVTFCFLKKLNDFIFYSFSFYSLVRKTTFHSGIHFSLMCRRWYSTSWIQIYFSHFTSEYKKQKIKKWKMLMPNIAKSFSPKKTISDFRGKCPRKHDLSKTGKNPM